MTKLITQIKTFSNILLNKFNIIKKPIAVRWVITDSCGFNCSYCNSHKIYPKEVDPKNIDIIINEIIKLKISRISLSGGEPLTSPYLKKIVTQLTKNNISPVINTSGLGIESQVDAIKMIDLIQFSCDGDKSIMTQQRNARAHEVLEKAIQVCLKHNVKFSFASTLTKHNVDKQSIEYMLDKAKKYNTVVAFQPIKNVHLQEKEYEELVPQPEQMQAAVNFLIYKKKEGNKNIRNSMVLLDHIKFWPKYSKLECTAGHLFFIIQPDGSIVSCDRTISSQPNDLNMLQRTDENILHKLKTPECEGCGFCGASELNLLYSLKLNTLLDLSKL